MQGPQRSLLIRLEGAAQRDDLIRFLGSRSCACREGGEDSVAVDDCDAAVGGLATLVALVEEWRAGARVAEAVLEVDAERRILRMEA